jgi:cation transport protein ChaC
MKAGKPRSQLRVPAVVPVSKFAINPPPTEAVDLSEAARRVHLNEFLVKAPDPGAIWVFAAGSLIWKPGFEPAEARNGTVHGYSRKFSFWTIRARGRPGNPGLGLALEPDSEACQGKVFRLHNHTQDGDLEVLWRREMFSGVYFPTWCPVVTSAGIVPAICFVGNRAHRNYAGHLPEHEAAAIIARAEGDWGRCREYLDLLVATLEREGLEDPAMVRLRDLVDHHEERQK